MTKRLKEMILDYKNKGERVDEVLFQEVMKVVDQSQKSEALLKKLYHEMGKSADDDIGLWIEVKRHVRSDG